MECNNSCGNFETVQTLTTVTFETILSLTIRLVVDPAVAVVAMALSSISGVMSSLQILNPTSLISVAFLIISTG